MTYVYWVYDKTCQDYKSDGYVGVTNYFEGRTHYHKTRNPKIPKNNELFSKVLFTGSREECFNKEYELRPQPGMGWNSAVGGAQGFLEGFVHSNETKQKLKNSWTDERRENVSRTNPEHAKRLTGRKRPDQSKRMTGSGNSMFGHEYTEETRTKMSDSLKGRRPWNKGKAAPQKTVQCPYCEKSGGAGNMKRYHFDNCKYIKNI